MLIHKLSKGCKQTILSLKVLQDLCRGFAKPLQDLEHSKNLLKIPKVLAVKWR